MLSVVPDKKEERSSNRPGTEGERLATLGGLSGRWLLDIDGLVYEQVHPFELGLACGTYYANDGSNPSQPVTYPQPCDG